MKKIVFIYLLLMQAIITKAQLQFNLTDYGPQKQTIGSLRHNDTYNNKKHKRLTIEEFDLLGKFSVHELKSNSNLYTSDAITPSEFQAGIPSPFLHYKVSPSIEFNTGVTGRMYFYKKLFFFESGIEWNYYHAGFDKINGSHIENAKWYLKYMKDIGEITKDSVTLATVTQERDIISTLSVPIFIGVHYKFLSISVGTVRDVYYWSKGTYKPDIGINYSFQGFVKNYNGRPLNPVVNLSATVIDRKFKLSPFISYRFKELFIGTEMGWNFKKA